MAFEGLGDKLGAVFKKLRSRGKLGEKEIKEVMREVRLALLEADVNYKVAKDFVSKVSERCMGAAVLESLTPAQQVIKIVHEELILLMGESSAKINYASKGPTVVMMCGLQGSGKTTHSGKLALHYKNQGKRPLLVACDIYRPAAIEQLKVVGEKVSVPVFEMGKEKPLKIAREAIKHAKDYGNDLVILDTAGRLEIDEELMNELKELKREIEPNEILFVVDAMTGQVAVDVSKAFDEALGIDGGEYSLHRALDDSRLSAECFKRVFDFNDLQSYIRPCGTEFYAKLAFKPHPISNLKNPLIDKKQLTYVCPDCRVNAQRLKEWKYSNRFFRTIFKCPYCGKMTRVSVRFMRMYDRVDVKKTTAPYIPPEEQTEADK
jgi:hypothetical protein